MLVVGLEQGAFFVAVLLKLAGPALALLVGVVEVFAEMCLDLGFDVVEVFVFDIEMSEVAGGGFFDLEHRDVAQVACAGFLAVDAIEVRVVAAPLSSGEGQPDTSTTEPASEQAAQIVNVVLFPLAAVPVVVELILDSRLRLGVNQDFMVSGVVGAIHETMPGATLHRPG